MTYEPENDEAVDPRPWHEIDTPLRSRLGLVIEDAHNAGPQEGVSLAGRVADAVLAAGYRKVNIDPAEIAGWIRDGVFEGRDAGESLYPVSERIAQRIVDHIVGSHDLGDNS